MPTLARVAIVNSFVLKEVTIVYSCGAWQISAPFENALGEVPSRAFVRASRVIDNGTGVRPPCLIETNPKGTGQVGALVPPDGARGVSPTSAG